MSVKETIQKGSIVIHSVASLVDDFLSDEVSQTVKNLVDTMRDTDLVGMAAPQIGISKRIFVTEVRVTEFRKEDLDELRVFINPEIIESSVEQVEEYEGCGSVESAHFFGPVSRPENITVKAQNEKGMSFELSVNGLLARVIQHEIDHLDGVLFSEKISDVSKVMNKEEYLKHKNK